MDITVRELTVGSKVLEQLLAVNLKAHVAYKVSRNARKLKYEMRDIEESQNELFKKYGTQQPNGQYMVSPEKIDEFSTEMNALMEETINIDIRPFPVEELGNIEIAGRVFEGLWFFFEEPDAVVPEATES